MLIHRIAAQLHTAEGLQVIEEALMDGQDATLAVSLSARTLVLASQFARHPRPCVYVVSGHSTGRGRNLLFPLAGGWSLCMYLY